jgi:methyl-accepting chemotaxis protein
MKATSEVTSMIQAIQSDTDVAMQAMGKGTQQAKAGVELVNGAGVTLAQIVEVVTKATNMVEQLAASIAEQSKVTSQVASNVQAVAEFSQKNELSILGLTGATGQLSEMAIDLREAVGQFKLNPGSVEEDPSLFERTRR